MNLSPKQDLVWREASARWNIMSGAVRSGKTFLTYFLLARRMRQQPAGNCLLIGKTETTLERNVLAPMREIFGAEYVSAINGKGVVNLFGRDCYVVGANDERAIQKIQGITLAYAYGDEFALWPEPFFQMLRSRLSVPGAKFDGTCNPEGPYHWAKTELFDKADGELCRAWHFTLDDNPFLDPQFVAALHSEYTGLWYKRYIQGLWVAAEGAIYDMFDETLHVVNTLPTMTRYWTAIDYGTINPTVFLLVGEGTDHCLYVIDEWRWDATKKGRAKTDQQYSEAYQTWIATHNIAPTWTFIDPSAASFIQQLHYDKVPHIAYADNNVLDGIRRVAMLLAAGRLKIHKRCQGLIQEISGYVWNPKAQEVGEDKPVKVADHGPDALRYLVNGTRDVWEGWMHE